MHTMTAPPPPAPPAPTPPTPRRRLRLWPAMATVVIVAALAGIAAFASTGDDTPTPSSADPAAAPVVSRLAEARNAAGQVQYLDMLDGGSAVSINGAPSSGVGGADVDTIVTFFVALDAPEVLYSRFDSTSSLMGLQEYEWDGLHVQWTYHPDNGLDILVEDSQS